MAGQNVNVNIGDKNIGDRNVDKNIKGKDKVDNTKKNPQSGKKTGAVNTAKGKDKVDQGKDKRNPTGKEEQSSKIPNRLAKSIVSKKVNTVQKTTEGGSPVQKSVEDVAGISYVAPPDFSVLDKMKEGEVNKPKQKKRKLGHRSTGGGDGEISLGQKETSVPQGGNAQEENLPVVNDSDDVPINDPVTNTFDVDDVVDNAVPINIPDREKFIPDFNVYTDDSAVKDPKIARRLMDGIILDADCKDSVNMTSSSLVRSGCEGLYKALLAQKVLYDTYKLSEDKVTSLEKRVEELSSKIMGLEPENKSMKTTVLNLKKEKAVLESNIEEVTAEKEGWKNSYSDLEKRSLVIADRKLASDRKSFAVFRSSLLQEIGYLSVIERLLSDAEENMKSSVFNIYVDAYNKFVKKRRENMVKFHEEKAVCEEFWGSLKKSLNIEDLVDERSPPLLDLVETDVSGEGEDSGEESSSEEVATNTGATGPSAQKTTTPIQEAADGQEKASASHQVASEPTVTPTPTEVVPPKK